MIRYVTRGGAKQTATDANRVRGRLWDPCLEEKKREKKKSTMTRSERFAPHSELVGGGTRACTAAWQGLQDFPKGIDSRAAP